MKPGDCISLNVTEEFKNNELFKLKKLNFECSFLSK